MFAALWAVVWVLVHGRSGAARWQQTVTVLASLVLALPLASSSSWLLQAQAVVGRAEPGGKLEAVAAVQRAAYEPLAVVVVGLCIVAVTAATLGRREVASESWLGAGLIGGTSLCTAATWGTAVLLAGLGMRPLAMTLWLLAALGAWVVALGALAYGLASGVRTARAA